MHYEECTEVSGYVKYWYCNLMQVNMWLQATCSPNYISPFILGHSFSMYYVENFSCINVAIINVRNIVMDFPSKISSAQVCIWSNIQYSLLLYAYFSFSAVIGQIMVK